MRPCNSTKKHYLCDVRFVFNATLWVLLIQDKEVVLLFLGKEEPFLIQMNTITHVLILRGVLWIMEMVSHQQPHQLILLCQNRFQRVRMHMNGRSTNPTLNSGLRHSHRCGKFPLCLSFPQWHTLDTFTNKLCRINRWAPRIFFSELKSGELIMPVVHMHTALFHKW